MRCAVAVLSTLLSSSTLPTVRHSDRLTGQTTQQDDRARLAYAGRVWSYPSGRKGDSRLFDNLRDGVSSLVGEVSSNSTGGQLRLPAKANAIQDHSARVKSMATYNMPGSVEKLLHVAIADTVSQDADKATKLLEKVQNGLDTVFSEAVKQDAGSKWRAKSGKDSFKISNTVKRNWEVKKNNPGKLLVFCIGIDQLTDDVGEFTFELPPFVGEWLKDLAK